MAIAQLLLLLAAAAAGAPDAPIAADLWETFSDPGQLDARRWVTIADGDFRERSTEVVEVGTGSGDIRLRLRADTRETVDESVKTVGVRSAPAVRLVGGVRIALELDWNAQRNGSYLSGAVVLSPHATARNPLRQADWLKVEYLGVPPGDKARMVIGLSSAGQQRTVYTEGWPESNRTGRKIDRQRLSIVIRDQAFAVWENGVLLYQSSEPVVMFDHAFLYLQLSSHSNYPARTVYFDNVRVERIAPDKSTEQPLSSD